MKDTKEPTMQPTGSGEKKGRIVELTPDMELRDDRKARIIDLTTARQGPLDPSEGITPAPASKASASTDPAPGPAEPSSAAPVSDNSVDIEADIDAAFDAMQSQQTEPLAESDEADRDEVTAEDAIELVDVVDPADLTAPQEMDDTFEDSLAAPPSETILEGDFDGETFAQNDLPEDDDVIELTDAVDLEREAAAQHVAASSEPESDEEDFIELTDIVEPDMSPDPAGGMAALSDDETEDEEIIDLVDMVAPEAVPLAAAASAAVSALAADDDDEVIELTDIVDPAELAVTPATSPEADEDEIIELTDRISQEAARLPDDAEDQVIRLDSILARGRRGEGHIEAELSQGLGAEVADNAAASVAEEGGIDLNDVRESLGGPTELTDKELEEAIERIIRTKYAETIERHIAAAVEKVVTREMESIKRSLMSDQDAGE